MSFRFSLRRHGCFATRKNKFRTSKTPGGGNKSLLLKKKPNFVLCGDKKAKLSGIKKPKFIGQINLPRNYKKVSRAYGGCLSGNAVKERIIKAFLIEEQKIVKKVLQFQKKKSEM